MSKPKTEAAVRTDIPAESPNQETLSAPAGHPAPPVLTKGTRKERGAGTSVSADLARHPEILADIRYAAAADDREVSNWLRRRLVQLHEQKMLIPSA